MFAIALKKFETQIHEEVASGKTSEVFSMIQTGVNALSKVYAAEMSAWLSEHDVESRLKEIREMVQYLEPELESYQINDAQGRIDLKLKTGTETSFPLWSLDRVLEEEFHFTKGEEGYFLVLGLCMRPSYFELLQLYHATKQIAGV